jgi:hypothetical protein
MDFPNLLLALVRGKRQSRQRLLPLALAAECPLLGALFLGGFAMASGAADDRQRLIAFDPAQMDGGRVATINREISI